MNIKLYDKLNFHELPWTAFADGLLAKSFLEPLVLDGIPSYIANIQTEFKILTLNQLILPITINEQEYDNAYACSPYTHYIKAPLEQSIMIKNPSLKMGVKGVFQLLSKVFKWGTINKVVCINNWLFPTLLHPPITQEELRQITDFLIKNFPHHTIYLRSLNERTDAELLNTVKKQGYAKVLSRPVYIFDPSSPNAFKANMLKKDLKLLENSPYKIEDITELTDLEIDKLNSLYRSIYIEKYSKNGSDYTQKFIKLAKSQNFLSLKIIKKESMIHGVYGYFKINGVMTMPFFGYDREAPTESGLYRLISTSLMLEAKRLKHILHLSSGAASFKRLRRAEQHMEYSAIYYKHLGIRKKIPWLILKILSPIGSYFLKKYGL